MTNSSSGRNDGSMTQPVRTRPVPQPRPSNVPDGVLTTVRRQDRLIAGVCSGLAVRYNVDPLLVRVAFVLLGLSLGIGLVLYAFCAVWMVEEGSSEPLIHQQVPSSRNWTWLWVMVGLVVACIVVMVTIGGLVPFGPMPAVILLGVWLWARHVRARAENRPMVYFPAQTPLQQQPQTHFDAASMAWRSRLESVYLSNDPLPPTPPQPLPVVDLYGVQPEPEPAAVPTGRRATRSSWLATLAMWLLAAAAFSGVHLLAPEGAYRWMLPAAAALGVIALFLVVGSFTRRPHLGVLSGLLVALTMFSSLAAPHLEPVGPAGTHVYSAAAAVPDHLDIRYRSTTLDFSQVELTGDQTLVLNVTGSSVTLKPSASTVIEYQLEGGVLTHQGTDHGAAGSGTIDLRQAGQPTLTIKVRARAAEVVVP